MGVPMDGTATFSTDWGCVVLLNRRASPGTQLKAVAGGQDDALRGGGLHHSRHVVAIIWEWYGSHGARTRHLTRSSKTCRRRFAGFMALTVCSLAGFRWNRRGWRPAFAQKGPSVAACEGRAGCPGGQAAHVRETSKKAIDVTCCFSNLISKGQQGTSVLGSYLSRTTPRCGHQTP